MSTRNSLTRLKLCATCLCDFGGKEHNFDQNPSHDNYTWMYSSVFMLICKHHLVREPAVLSLTLTASPCSEMKVLDNDLNVSVLVVIRASTDRGQGTVTRLCVYLHE